MSSGQQRTGRIGGEDIGFGQAEFAAHDVGPAHERDHLVERVQPAHALAAEAAIGRDDQTTGIHHLERAPDQRRDFLRPLHLQRTMAHDADGDFLVRRNPGRETLDLVAAVGNAALIQSQATGAVGEATAAPMAQLPLLLIPAYLVPLFLMLHVTALIQARRTAQTEQ